MSLFKSAEEMQKEFNSHFRPPDRIPSMDVSTMESNAAYSEVRFRTQRYYTARGLTVPTENFASPGGHYEMVEVVRAVVNLTPARAEALNKGKRNPCNPEFTYYLAEGEEWPEAPINHDY